MSLGRCKPFLRVPSCGCRVSIATGGASCRPSHVRNAPLATVGPKKAACRDGPETASRTAEKWTAFSPSDHREFGQSFKTSRTVRAKSSLRYGLLSRRTLVPRLCMSVSRAPGNPEVSRTLASGKRKITSRASAQSRHRRRSSSAFSESSWRLSMPPAPRVRFPGSWKIPTIHANSRFI